MLSQSSIEDIDNVLFEFLLQNTMTPGEHSEFLNKTKAHVRCFKSNLDVQVY